MTPQPKLISFEKVKDKTGRVDVLLGGLAGMLTKKLEVKLNLPGLSEGVMPILENEIKKVVPAKKMIPKEYQKLANLLGAYVNNSNSKGNI